MGNRIIIATHGDLGKGLLQTAEMIGGVYENVQVYGVYPDTDLEEFKETLQTDIRLNPEGVLILLDLWGGTPFNSVMESKIQSHVKFVTGVNLPMVLEVLSQADLLDIDELSNMACEMGVSGIRTKRDILERM